MTKHLNIKRLGGASTGVLVLVALMLGVLFALLSSLIALAPQAHAAVAPATARAVGPTDASGFPAWYQDDAGRRVSLCDPASGMCAMDLPPGEQFYFAANAVKKVGAVSARVDMGVEASSDPAAGQPPVTNSIIKITAKGLKPAATYTVRFPYGTKKFIADDRGNIKFAQNVGCVVEAPAPGAPAPTCNFRAALASPIFQRFLRWAPDPFNPAPVGFLGDSLTPHTVVGSPVKDAAGKPQNYFRIEGPNAGGSVGANVLQTKLFTVQGQIAQQ
jgi:hypothetical protein